MATPLASIVCLAQSIFKALQYLEFTHKKFVKNKNEDHDKQAYLQRLAKVKDRFRDKQAKLVDAWTSDNQTINTVL
jgi:hypothetical protein